MIFKKRINIAVVVTDQTPHAQFFAAKKAGVAVAEARLDCFKSLEPQHLSKSLARFKDFSLLVTVRSKKEGAKKNYPDAQRFSLFQSAISVCAAVDIELSSKKILKGVVRLAKSHKKTVIISFHDFKKTPPGAALNRIYKEAKKAGADFVKVAAWVNTTQDLRRLAEWTLDHPDVICIGMGPKGAISRTLFPLLGSKLTFAHAGESTAPGQKSVTEIRQIFDRAGLGKW